MLTKSTMLFSYRILPLFEGLLNEPTNGLILKTLKNLIYTESNVDDEFIFSTLDKYKHTIRYLSWDMRNVWDNLQRCLDDSHDMPIDILLDYAMSMRELLMSNPPASEVLAILSRFIRGRLVLDIGCGAGHYYEILRPLSPAKYVGIDKIKVMIPNLMHLVSSCGLQFIPGSFPHNFEEKFDTILLAEVLHGKSYKYDFIGHCAKVLNNNGRILIIEPTKNARTLRAITMDMQMSLHCGIYEQTSQCYEKLSLESAGIVFEETYPFNDELACYVYRKDV